MSYYAKGRFATYELYKDNPFTVELDYSVPQMVGVRYSVKILDNGEYVLSAKAENASKYDFNERARFYYQYLLEKPLPKEFK